MARSLRKRVTLAIIIPLVLGMIILTTVTCVPLYIQYNGYISDYNNHMVNNEKNTMKILSNVISNTESNGIFSYISSLSQLASSLITDFYFGRIKSNKNILDVIIEPPQSSNFNDYNLAIGSSNASSLTKDPNYYNSTAFFYFIQPISALGKIFANTMIASYIAYENNFFMFSPASTSLYQNFTAGNRDFNKTSWWNISQNARSDGDILVFVNTTYNIVCKPLYLHGLLGTLPCIIYSIGFLEEEFPKYYSDKEKIVIVDEKLDMYYPSPGENYCIYTFGVSCTPIKDQLKLSTTELSHPNIRTLDMKNPLKASEDYSEIYYAALYHNSTKQFDFDKNGKPYVFSISPYNISLPLAQSYTSYFSVILSTSKSEISKKFDRLSSHLTLTIIIQVAVFLVVLVAMIFFVCIVAYQITGSILFPIDELYNILQRLHTDLGVDVKLHQKKGPPEIINLYEVFDKLRLILKFEDAKLFNEPAFAMMNYAQALKLFNDFNNKAAMEICYEEIGHIHMNAQRYLEAAINYHSSYSLAEELVLNASKIAVKKVNTAKALMAAKTKLAKAKELFVEVILYYENHDPKLRIITLLEFAECLLENNENADTEIKKLNTCLHRIPESSEGFVILQRFLYLKGLQSYLKQHLRQSAGFLTECLEAYPVFERKTRKKALKLLKKIFKKSGLPLDQLNYLEISLRDSCKDVVLVVDSKIGGALNDEILLDFMKFVISPSDRMSFIQFDECCQVLFNMTRLPRRRCSTNTSLFDLRNICVLNDAIICALRQIMSIKSLIPKSFLNNESPHQEWIIVITHGEDSGSQINDYSLTKELYSSSANLVIIAVTPDEEVLAKLNSLVKVTRSGLLIPVNDFSNIEHGLLQAAAFISNEKELIV